MLFAFRLLKFDRKFAAFFFTALRASVMASFREISLFSSLAFSSYILAPLVAEAICILPASLV